MKQDRQVIIAATFGHDLGDPNYDLNDRVLFESLLNYITDNNKADILWVKGNIAKTKTGYIAAFYEDEMEVISRMSDN